jgi:DNA-binding NarL/FixJ family response regulator
MRVIIADDASLFREGLARILADEGVDVIGQAAEGRSAVAMTASSSPDAVVLDIRMPPTHTTEGLDAAIEIRRSHPGVAVLVLSQYVETSHAVGLLSDRRGGVGYLLKERVADIAQLTRTLDRLCAGDTVIDPEVVAVLLDDPGRRHALACLTERELEILDLMAQGRSNLAIGESLFVAPKTVESHVRSIFLKLDLLPAPDDHRRVLAVLTYLQR